MTGDGDYEAGKKVSLKIYPNIGCTGIKAYDGSEKVPSLHLKKKGVSDSVDVTSGLQTIYDDSGVFKYYEYVIDSVTGSGDNMNVGTYKTQFYCVSRDISGTVDSKQVTVTYTLVESNGEYNIYKFPAETIEQGTKITEKKYADGITGKIKWYKTHNQSTNTFSDPFTDYSIGISEDLTLYGEIVQENAGDIVKEAIDNLNKETQVQMVSGNYTATAKYKSEENSMILEQFKLTEKGIGNNDTTKFIISGNDYYKYIDGKYYKMTLGTGSGTSGYTKEDINGYNMFFKYKLFNKNDFSVEKDNSANKVVNGVTCEVYKAIKENLELKFWIYRGVIHKVVATEKVTGEADKVTDVTISYPEEIPVIDLVGAKNLYLVKIETSDTDLNDRLNETFNNSFDTVLNTGIPGVSTTEDLLDLDDVREILKEYDYSISGAPDLDTVINQNLDLTLTIKGKYSDVETAKEEIKTECMKIKTSITAFGETIMKEYSVTSGENVLELGAKPDTMEYITWETLQILKNLKTTYYSFDVENGVYSFYKNKDNEKAGNPYVKITIADGRVTKVVYLYTGSGSNPTDPITYTTEFEYPVV